MTDSQILYNLAVQIRDAVQEGENTASRVGTLFVKIIDAVEQAKLDFLSGTEDDVAEGLITFLKGLVAGTFVPGESGAAIDAGGNLEAATALIRGLLKALKIEAGDVRSGEAVGEGFDGSGFRLWVDDEGRSHLVVDDAVFRGTLKVFELLLSKIRAVGGQVIVSAASGKVKTVEDVSRPVDQLQQQRRWRLTFETANEYVAGDFIRSQVYTPGQVRGYWVPVAEVNGDSADIVIPYPEEVVPVPGDETVMLGSTNAGRQNAILISATDDGKPRIDVLGGINKCGGGLAEFIRGRFGDLGGLPAIGGNTPAGMGLYGDNVFLKGTFVLDNGKTVVEFGNSIKQEITDGLKTTGINIENGEVTVSADKTTFTDSEGDTQALLENGKLNTSAIDADSMTARRVEVQYPDTGQPAVTILPVDKGMKVYDENGLAISEFTGVNRSNPLAGFSAPVPFKALPAQFTLPSYDEEGGSCDFMEYTLSEEWSPAPRVSGMLVHFSSGTVGLSLRVPPKVGSGSNVGKLSAIIYLVGVAPDGEEWYSEEVARFELEGENADTNKALDFTGTGYLAGSMGAHESSGIITGNYRLKLYLSAQNVAEAKCVLSELAATHNDNLVRTRYFGNGMAVQRGRDEYFYIFPTTWGGFQVCARSGEYGLLIDRKRGIQVFDPVTEGYTRLPMLFYRGRVLQANGSPGTVASAGAYTYNPAFAASAADGGRTVYIYFPTEWKKLRGGLFHEKIHTKVYTYNPDVRAVVAWTDSERICLKYTAPYVDTDIEIYIS